MRPYHLAPLFLAALLAGCGALPPAPPAEVASQASAGPIAARPAPSSPAAPRMSERSPELLLQALSAAGFDYRYGGTSHASGFDCSGLVAHVYDAAYGIKLPHNARAQSTYGKPVQVADLEVGDLVFFNTEKRPYSHVGIYLGDQRFIHAPKTGAVVRTESMSKAYWQKRFDGARRIVAD